MTNKNWLRINSYLMSFVTNLITHNSALSDAISILNDGDILTR